MAKTNPFEFIQQVRSEMSKVTWPTRNETVVTTIMVLIMVGHVYPAGFDFMHLYFWQATLIIMITSVWALWIFQVVIRETPSDHHA